VVQLLQQIENSLRHHRLLPPGQRLLVAVSGGVDSMVLLHVLQRLAVGNRWQLVVAHFNHQLRGRASDADERLVRQTAEKLSLPFVSERGDVAALARSAKLSVEMAARKLRHEFLARVAREQKCRRIVLAHHADDQMELFFLRLLRGAGGTGLAGMQRNAPAPADARLRLVRPLLDLTKADLRAYAAEHRLRFREDATNRSNDPLRNRLRNDWLPRLQKDYQPGLVATVLRTMDIIGAEAEFAAHTARAWLADQADNVVPFDKLPLAVQRQVVHQQLSALGVPAEFERIEQLREPGGKPVNVGPGLFVQRTSRGRLVRHQPVENAFHPETLNAPLVGTSGKLVFGGKTIHWQAKALKKFIRPQPATGRETFDADRVGKQIRLRHWQPGDRFQPIGLPGSAKLQDLFVNAKIPAARRRQLVVATTAAGEIFWVEGLRLGEAFKLTSHTRRQLVWRWI